MKILYVVEKLSCTGGMERILTDKMNYLVANTQHEVVLMLLWHDNHPFAYRLDERVRVIRLDANPKLKLQMMWRFRRTARREQPDITIYTWVMGALLAAYGGWHGGSCIYEAHRARPTMHYQWLQAAMEKRVDAVVTLTQQDANQYHEARKVVAIPNFTTLTAEAKADHNGKRCLAIGRLIDAKDFSRLLDIWKKVSEKHKDWTLDIVGDGPEEKNLQQKIEALNLKDCVTLHHSTNDIESYYRQSSIFLMTSKFEGLGIVLIEAMTCGLAVVSVDCDYGPRHLISNGENGFLTPYTDNEVMASEICKLIDNKLLREKIGQSAIISSLAYQPVQVMEKWLKLFTELRQNS